MPFVRLQRSYASVCTFASAASTAGPLCYRRFHVDCEDARGEGLCRCIGWRTTTRNAPLYARDVWRCASGVVQTRWLSAVSVALAMVLVAAIVLFPRPTSIGNLTVSVPWGWSVSKGQGAGIILSPDKTASLSIGPLQRRSSCLGAPYRLKTWWISRTFDEKHRSVASF